MTRKDIIIVAVLINAGLLVALFSTALKTDAGDMQSLELQPQMGFSSPEITMKSNELLPIKHEETPQKTAPQEIKKVSAKEQPSEDLFVVSEKVEEKPIFKNDSQDSSAFITIQVKKGDMLEKLARTYKTSVDAIIELNQLSSTRLNIGQPLRIPVEQKENHVAESKCEDPQFYTVKSGDNPWTIAHKNHLQVDQLLELNHLNEEKARRLKPGDKLRIR